MEHLVQLSSIAAPFVATVAIIVAIFQIRIGRIATQRAAAYTIYQGYLKLAMDNIDCSYPNQGGITLDPNLRARYKWYIANMLLSFEEILMISENQDDWKTAIKSQLKTHSWYLAKSSSVRRGDWKPALSSLIADVTGPN